MGTKSEAVELQKQIKQLISGLGWSQNRLAEYIYADENDSDNDADKRAFQERLKKELQRPTTKVEKLKKYLSIILKSREARQLDLRINSHVPIGCISKSMSAAMKEISKEVDEASKPPP